MSALWEHTNETRNVLRTHTVSIVLLNHSRSCILTFSTKHYFTKKSNLILHLKNALTSAQYCCLVSESMCAKPPRTSAFISVRWIGLDSRCRGGLRLANCLARLHQFSHCTTMFALMDRIGKEVKA